MGRGALMPNVATCVNRLELYSSALPFSAATRPASFASKAAACAASGSTLAKACAGLVFREKAGADLVDVLDAVELRLQGIDA